MEKIKLRFIQTMSATLIGEAVEGKNLVLLNPRTCQADHDKGIINLVPLLGNPEKMVVNDAMVIHTYMNKDPLLDAFYDKEIKNPQPVENVDKAGLSLVEPDSGSGD